MTELTEFCRRVTAIQENNEHWYLRIRCGAQRKSAQVIASGIPCTGIQPLQLERELEERIRAAGAEESVWIEAMKEGTSQIKDTIKMEFDAEDDQPPAGSGFEASLHSLTQALVAITLREQERSERNFAHLMDAQGAFMRTFQELAVSQARLENESAGGMGEAIAMLAPLMPAVASRLTEQKQIAPTNLDEHADGLVGAVVALAKDHPEVITPERLSQLASVLQ